VSQFTFAPYRLRADLHRGTEVGHSLKVTRSIPWPRILAEGGAIVVSILLAFGIQAWWEGVQERSSEAVYLTAILDEIDRNLSALDGNMNVAEAGHDALRQAQRLLDQGTYADSADVFVASLLRGARTGGPPRVATSVFDELTSTGRIVVIQDLNLRREILELYARTQITFERMDRSADQLGVRLYGTVARHVPPDIIERGPQPLDYSVSAAGAASVDLEGVARSIALDPVLPSEIRLAFMEYQDSGITRARYEGWLLEVRHLLEEHTH
jgi:hypothetical protein